MALLMSTADAKIVFQHMDTNQTVSITAYNTLAWKTQESETKDITVPSPLIPLHEKIDGVFNPCDISTYVPGSENHNFGDFSVKSNCVKILIRNHIRYFSAYYDILQACELLHPKIVLFESLLQSIQQIHSEFEHQLACIKKT